MLNKSYLRIISFTVQLSPPSAFIGSVKTGRSICGISLYTTSSDGSGSTIINLITSGVELYNILIIIECMQMDLPEPVVPKISKDDIVSISRITGPEASIPIHTGIP